MFEEQSGFIISNRNKDHARVLIEKIIGRGASKVDIFCQNLDKEVYGTSDVFSALLVAGIKGSKVRILCQEPPTVTDLPARVARFFQPDQFELRTCLPNSTAAKVSYNFVVAGSSFRFETDRENKKAFASANSPDLAEQMSSQFEEFWLQNP